jgi:hypothetical protein
VTLSTPKVCPNCGGTDISYLWYNSFFCHGCDHELVMEDCDAQDLVL